MSRLCETLNDLNSEELEKFKTLIDLETGFPLFSRNQHEMTNTWDIVELMVETYSRQYLGLTKYVLKLMERTDLVQRLIETCPATKGKWKKRQKYVKNCHTLTCTLYVLYYILIQEQLENGVIFEKRPCILYVHNCDVKSITNTYFFNFFSLQRNIGLH